MKKLLGFIILLGLLGVGIYYFSGDKAPEGQPNGFSGIYIGDVSACSEKGCFSLKDELPQELLFVWVADKLPLCSEVEKGWCKETSEMATATLLGYFQNSFKVRSFYLKK